MKIGIFDSGLGGLVIAKAIFKKLPQYDYLYLGDTKRLPYGDKSQKEILKFTEQALNRMFAEDCQLVIIACNTSSAEALKSIQRKFLPKFYPEKKVLGVIVPTLECIPKSSKKIAILATKSTVKSHAYKKELRKIRPEVQIIEQPAPKLVPLIEANRLTEALVLLQSYLQTVTKKNIDTLVLGCTHYQILSKQIKKIVGNKIKVISQVDIIPEKLKKYLSKHREIDMVLSKNRKRTFEVTKINQSFIKVTGRLFGKKIQLRSVNLL